MSYSIDIDADDPKSVEAALRTEWLLTNGLGGYAMGTTLGVNMRRYHGLLVAATKPPVGRIVALHSIIEQLILPRDDGSEDVIDLSTQQFVGADGQPMLHPNGWRHIRAFEQTVDGVRWQWAIDGAKVYKHLAFLPGRNDCVIGYAIEGLSNRALLRVRPFLPMRDFHSIASRALPPTAKVHEDGCAFESDGFRMRFTGVSVKRDETCRSARWIDDPQQWKRFAYQLDRERGQDWSEDIWTPGYFEATLPAANRHAAGFRIELRSPRIDESRDVLPGMCTAFGDEQERKTQRGRLNWATTAFVVRRRQQTDSTTSVIAGYPWFGDWGRDTMIALPGLMLCMKRFDEARSTLECFAKHLLNGLIPNLFDDYGGAAHYNTVDASLWFVHAVHAYMNAQSPSPKGRGGAAPDDDLLRACREIIAAYRNGTDYSIFMDSDGLISAGDESTQLTWMDAARDGVIFTPRCGKAVEINALWHNALMCMAEMTGDANERSDLKMLASKIATSFRDAFWWDERKCLHDCLVPSGRDETSRAVRFAADGKLRPNQIFAVSLPFSPLNDAQKRAVVKAVGERLLTPFGLRTLDRDDPKYKPRYEGNLFERDAAYHNGTVWPWLMGAYCEAVLRVENFSEDAKRRVRTLLQPLIDEMSNTSGGRCLGQIAEVYDADPPHRPSGCPAQAWSIAETLRALTLASDE